jgi:hypothetical protein
MPAESFGSEAGYRRCQGEAMRGNPQLKTAMESSVWSKDSLCEGCSLRSVATLV